MQQAALGYCLPFTYRRMMWISKNKKLNIIKTAARLIKNDLKSLATSSGNYPMIDTNAESHVHFLPATLSAFLGVLVSEKIIR